MTDTQMIFINAIMPLQDQGISVNALMPLLAQSISLNALMLLRVQRNVQTFYEGSI